MSEREEWVAMLGDVVQLRHALAYQKDLLVRVEEMMYDEEYIRLQREVIARLEVKLVKAENAFLERFGEEDNEEQRTRGI